MNFFIRLPAGFQLRVQGGQVQNDRLTAANGTTVLFYGVRSTGLSEADNESPDAHSDEPGENSGNDDDDVEAQDSSSSSANDDAQVRPRSRSPRRYGFAGYALCLHITGRLIHQPLLHPSLFQVLLASELAVVSCKILEEPTPYTARQLENLDTLRYFAGEFGLEWRYTPAWALYERLERCAPIPVPAALPVVAAAQLHFEVLVPGYLVERIVLTAVLPVAVDYILQLVQAERSSDSVRRFPVLVPAIPQPVSHTGLLVALPAWNPQATVIIIDARALDGRLFAIQAPLYVAKYTILQLAGVPVGAHVTVCFAGDGEPLPLEGEFRVFTGQCFLLLPRNAPVPPPYDLGDMLRTPGSWVSAPPVLPPDDTPDCYCCVTEQGHILHATDSSRPWEYRSEIAAICNVPVGNVSIQPTSPRVQDCQVFGYTCRAVVAVGPNAVNAFYVVVDCRPLMQGWNCFLTSGTLDILAVYEELGVFAPPGWYVRLCEVSEAASTVPVRPGQLFVAEYVQFPPDEDLSDFPWMTGHQPPSGPDDPDTRSDSHSENDLPSQDSWLIPGGSDVSGNTTEAGNRNHHQGHHAPADVVQDVTWNCGTTPPACVTRPRGDTPFSLERSHRGAARRHRARTGLLVRLPAHVFVACLLHCCPAVTAVGTAGIDASLQTPALCKDTVSAKTFRRQEISGTDAHVRHFLRTMPTPCRATMSTPLAADVPDLGDLITLLDESAASSCQWAFLASTLLEILFEHFQGAQGQAVFDKVHINLVEAVPVSSFQADCLSLAQLLPKPVTDLTVQPDWLDNDLRAVLHSTVMSLRFRTALVNVRPWHENPCMDDVIAVDIFTDGSASGTEEPLRSAPGSWAFSVWMRKQHESLYYGAAAAVVAQPDTAFFLGEPGDGPLPCETLALCWALTWVIQYGPACRRPIHLWYDCLAAGKGTFGEHKPAHLQTCEGYGSLSWFAVVLRQIAQHRVNLTADYVPGHAGYLGNELSDGLAKLARLQSTGSEEPLLPLWPGELARHPLAAWAWLVDQAPADMPTLYAFEATAGYMQRQVPRTRPAPTMGLSSLPGADSPATFWVRCISYNVLTLLDKDGRAASRAASTGMRLVGKKHLMTAQLLDAQVLFVGLQETRLQETATLPDRHFTCLHSAATPSGQLGCALWISKCTPYAHVQGVPLYIAVQHCTVVAFSPRHILVSVEAPRFACYVLVAHAPSDPQDPSFQVRDFWRHRQQEIDRLRSGVPLILLTDANSRLGSLVSPAVSGHAAETETVAGGHFHDFLVRNHLCLPATFTECHSGESWTWHSVFDTRHRLDYVAIPQTWMAFHVRTTVLYAFESLQKKYDHVPTQLTCSFQEAGQTGTASVFARKACRPNDLDTKIDKRAFGKALQERPLSSWSTDVDSHYASFVDDWFAAGQAVLTPSRPIARQFFLTEQTMDLVGLRKQLRHYLRQENQELRRRRLVLGFVGFALHQRGQMLSRETLSRVDAWFRDVNISISRAWAVLSRTCQHLRASVKADRNAYLDTLVKEVRLADIQHPKQLYQKVRKAFPKAASARRSKFVALPAVELADGMLAPDNEARAQRWRDHFASQESGEQTTAEAYSAAVHAADQRRHAQGAVLFRPLPTSKSCRY